MPRPAPPRLSPVVSTVLAVLLVVLAAGGAAAQEWPSAPISAFGGRLTIGGDITATIGSDDPGYFNFTDYGRDALRLGRADLVAILRPDEHVSFLVELRAEGDLFSGHWTTSPYAAYVQVRPWALRPVEIRAGRIPAAFGGFAQRTYGTGNLLIGYPLAAQYLTSLREDSIPADADELLAARGRGWYVAYSVGDPGLDAGVPLVSAFRYDTGGMVRVGTASSRAEWLASVTTGTLSYPLAGDDNGSLQVASRLVLRPVVGLALGVSGARGAFLANRVRDELPGDLARRQYPQRAFGADAEYSRGHWLVRSEGMITAWTLPALEEPVIQGDLVARSWLAEGRYTLTPQLYAAARVDWLGFSDVRGSTQTDTWDANVHRVEGGIGYRMTRTVTLKASVQRDHRDGGRVRDATLGAMQVVLWF